jgi:hypothetical protein
MHHFTLHTSKTLVDRPYQIKAFQEWCPGNISNYPFLLEGMLAVAAFHVASLRPDETSLWVPIALNHQAAGLVGLRNFLKTEPTGDNCHCLFAQSLILSTTSFANSRYNAVGELEPSTIMDDVLEPLMHVRGAGELCLTSYGWIKDGPFAELLPENFLRVEGGLPEAIEARIGSLKTVMWENYSRTSQEIHLLGAIEALRFVYKEVCESLKIHANSTENLHTQNLPRYAWKWPNLVNQSYINLLRSHDAGALVIFAHFAMLSGVYNGHWYFVGWASRAVHAVTETLPQEWKHWTHWPLSQILVELDDFRHNPPLVSSSYEQAISL